MRSHSGEITWSIPRINDMGEEVDVEYDVEYDWTAGESAKTYGPPEKCHPGSPSEFEVTKITLCNDGHGWRRELDPKNWEAAGFDQEQINRMQEKVEADLANEAQAGDEDAYDRTNDR